jgi:hypothetical protein
MAALVDMITLSQAATKKAGARPAFPKSDSGAAQRATTTRVPTLARS